MTLCNAQEGYSRLELMGSILGRRYLKLYDMPGKSTIISGKRLTGGYQILSDLLSLREL